MTQPIYTILYVLIFVTVIAAVQGTSFLIFSKRDRAERVNRRLTMLESGMEPAEVYASLVRVPALPFEAGTRLSEIYQSIWNYYRQSGVSISLVRLVWMTAAMAGALWLVSMTLLLRFSGKDMLTNGAVSLAASVVLSVWATWLWLALARAKRQRALEEQMPLALDVINRALKAGHPVISAVQLAANEMGDPIGSEFGLVVDETTYGFDFKDSLRNFASRTGSADAHFFAICISIQSETGGNLAEILGGLADVIRGRSTLGKRVKALASEGRASAILLSALPPLLISVLFLFHPSYYTSKFADPIFWPTVASVSGVYLIGWLVIHRIINFRY